MANVKIKDIDGVREREIYEVLTQRDKGDVNTNATKTAK